MRNSKLSASMCVVVLASLGLAACGGDDDDSANGAAGVPQPSDFSVVIDNPYLPWEPGMKWTYRGTSGDGVEEIVVEVTDKTKVVDGITARVVRDTVMRDGKLLEDTSDWYAQDSEGNVWYLGEDTTSYEDGTPDKEGSWEAGVDGARAGIVMKAHPKAGDSYEQEHYEGHAEDHAEVTSIDATAKTPYGSFNDVVQTHETTPLDPSVDESKFYARGIGVVLELDPGNDERVELISFEHA